MDICGCGGTFKYVSGEISRGCRRHVSIAYILVFFLHFSLVFTCRKDYGGHQYFPYASFQLALVHEEGIIGLLSFSEPAALSRVSDSSVPYGSGTEFKIGRTTSCERGADAAMNAPQNHETNMSQFYFCIG